MILFPVLKCWCFRTAGWTVYHSWSSDLNSYPCDLLVKLIPSFTNVPDAGGGADSRVSVNFSWTWSDHFYYQRIIRVLSRIETYLRSSVAAERPINPPGFLNPGFFPGVLKITSTIGNPCGCSLCQVNFGNFLSAENLQCWWRQQAACRFFSQ